MLRCVNVGESLKGKFESYVQLKTQYRDETRNGKKQQGERAISDENFRFLSFFQSLSCDV
jgi:hypothetical protein